MKQQINQSSVDCDNQLPRTMEAFYSNSRSFFIAAWAASLGKFNASNCGKK